ncbi:unnamed protein product [Ceutorhynchus assimilis]|uniref:F-box domain-containing protein n=1 Tax=Ceutorhynchus assimilis TaxID=467358 RepID=A0A9N9MXY2_9CUCU|nr:unnamed protein product [Ceutorhynchus assimilis]
MATKSRTFLPIENSLKMRYLEQYAHAVVHYSSKYNSHCSYSYAPHNLVGKYVKYPSYGDFQEAYFLRSYGKWWKTSSATQKDYRPQDFDLLGAEDFITLEFGSTVVPREIFIYEVYNPGAVIRIWGRLKIDPKWHLLWEGFPQKCAPKSRKFCPPLRKINCLINIIRLEFNQSHLEYHTAIDAVLLSGYQPETTFQSEIIRHGLTEVKFNTPQTIRELTVGDLEKRTKNQGDVSENLEPVDCFCLLPDEIIINIFHYLDLKSLSRCAQVNHRWNKLARDQTLYQNISLKIYWYLVDTETLDHFQKKIVNLKKLDLSWCNEHQLYFHQRLNYDYHLKLQSIIEGASKTLTHLSLNDNYFVDFDVIGKINQCTELVDLRLHNSFNWIRCPLDKLTNLVSLDLSLTYIIAQDLIQILMANPHLENLNLDLCEKLVLVDQIVETVAMFNKKLKTWRSWKSFYFTPDGIRKFGLCQNLEELDLGWCLIDRDPGDCLLSIANGCKRLKRLILSEWRGLSEQLLMPVILSCKELTQIDLIGIKTITADVCENALFRLPKLRLLDISFCDGVRQSEVEIWRQQYPHITIQRSCEFIVTDYL